MTEEGVLKQLLADYLEWVLLGERRRLTAAGLIIAGVMILVASMVEYLVLTREIAGGDPHPLLWLERIFELQPFWESTLPLELWVYGYLLVILLAGVYAYFNAGYLVSVLLGISPNIGTALWVIYGYPGDYVGLAPHRVLERVLPESPLVATLGFLLGMGLRLIKRQHTPTQPQTPTTPER